MNSSSSENYRNIILGMRSAFARGENAIEWAASHTQGNIDRSLITLIAYDLQAGGLRNCGRAGARANPEAKTKKLQTIASLLDPFTAATPYSLIEVGCGEAVTLAGVLRYLKHKPHTAMGLDISWSRIAEGRLWLEENNSIAALCVADLFTIPLPDDSVDVLYTAHALEPNGGREEKALRELLRVTRDTVVLVEPIYELASPEARKAMKQKGYIRGLRAAAKRLGAVIVHYGPVAGVSANPLNPSGALVIRKPCTRPAQPGLIRPFWHCPLTHTPLTDLGGAYFSKESGLVYPILREVPLLRPEHAVVASRFAELEKKQE